MGDLTKNLSRYEFACKCGCGMDAIDYKLITIVQDTVDMLQTKYDKVRVVVNSGNRCLTHNEDVQLEYNKKYVSFSSKSQHLHNKAGDFVFQHWDEYWKGIGPTNIYEYLDDLYPNTLGLGLYNNRIHIDSRKFKARWVVK